MWEQIFTLTGVRLVTSPRATTVKLPANHRTDVSSDDRADEIRFWLGRIRSDGFEEQWDAEVADALRRTAVDQTRRASELSEELVAIREWHAEELSAVHGRHAEETDELGRILSDERRHRMEAERAIEQLRGEHAALLAEHHRLSLEHHRLSLEHQRLSLEMGRVAGTRTWRLRSRLLRHPIVGPMYARRPGG